MPARYAFLGPVGTFAHAALLRIPAAADTEQLPMATVTLAIDAVRSGAADGALVPMENSVEGAVPATLDELANGEQSLAIAQETYLPVEFDLLVREGTTLDEIRTITTHPHAEAQVRRFLLTNLPGAHHAAAGSTAAGAGLVASGEADAAVAPPTAGERYGLVSLARDIADHPGAVTRFVLLTRAGRPGPPTGNDRSTLVAYLREDHSGALLEILTEFAMRGVNLTRIESRPTKGRLGQYCFSIDCEGHIRDARVGDALAAIHRICADVRFLGSYPRADGVQGPVLIGRSDPDFADATAWLASVRDTGA
ncbi:MAG: prephenate dehydratase [Jatrophihabitans sp.]